MGRLNRVIAGTAAIAGAVALMAGSAQGAVNVSQSGWQWGNPTPQGNTVRAIDFVGGRGYAIGDAGTALRTDDGGATWSGLATGTSQNLTRVQAVTPDVVVVLGGDGCVARRSDDGGRTFRKMFVLAEVDCPDRIQAAFFVDPTTGYLILRDGNVLRTTDGGQTFSRQTAIPGTPASTGGGAAIPADGFFTSPDAGVVFLGGGTTAFRTTDAGTSWTPEPDVEPGSVERIKVVDAQTVYAFGPDTLLQSTDAGQTFRRRGAGNEQHITGVSCASSTLCLLSTLRGDRLLRTENGGGTAESITAATQALFAAGFATPTRAVAAGLGGATVVSDDGGRNYAPVGGDIAGSYPFGLRLGPAPGIAYALGARGQLARTVDGGVTYRAINVSTTADLQDTAFSSVDVGYALDQRGGLFKTANGGQSWSTLDPGTTSPARALITAGPDVLLAGRLGVRIQRGGDGTFDLTEDRTARRAPVDRFDRAGSALFAYGTTTAIRTTNRGRTWTKIQLPGRRVGGRYRSFRMQDVEMTSATSGYALEINGRVWRTTSGGRRWSELAGVGTGAGLSLSFGSATGGSLTLSGFAADRGASYVLRTSDGGRTWRPQRIATGAFPGTEGVISPTATRSYALTSTPAAGREVFRSLFTTSTGGDLGSPSRLTLTTDRRTLSRRQLRAAGGRLTIKGTLPGAQGGERIVVSSRPSGSGRWASQVVTAGANGGSFTAALRATGSTEIVAQFAGDSGRQGAGSTPLIVRVR